MTKNNHWQKVRVGSLIAVYWEEYKCYYACKVLRIQGSKFQIKYEDNSTEWRVLSKSRFRWQDFEPPTDDESSEGEEQEDDEEVSDMEDAAEIKRGIRNFIETEAVEAKGNDEDE